MITINKIAIILFFMSFISCIEPIPTITSPKYSINSNTEYNRQVNVVIEAWTNDSSLPDASTTSCNIDLMQYSFLTDMEFLSLSQTCAAPIEGQVCAQYQEQHNEFICSNGCAYGFYSNNIIYISKTVLDYSTKEETINSLIRHESIHWLSQCTGHYVQYPNSDALHMDTRLWGNIDSVSSRARILQMD